MDCRNCQHHLSSYCHPIWWEIKKAVPVLALGDKRSEELAPRAIAEITNDRREIKARLRAVLKQVKSHIVVLGPDCLVNNSASCLLPKNGLGRTNSLSVH